MEMFVGVGPARVRDLFAQARAQAPSMIFIGRGACMLFVCYWLAWLHRHACCDWCLGPSCLLERFEAIHVTAGCQLFCCLLSALDRKPLQYGAALTTCSHQSPALP